MEKYNKLIDNNLNDRILIKCWGENVENNVVQTQKYISCVINKVNFKYLNKYIESGLEFNKFDYVEIIYNQLLENITLDFNAKSKEQIIETSWGIEMLFNILKDIKSNSIKKVI
ncbi:hypothetical protein KYB31_15805 [Clostridium felsineum]|uniref:hypothetical protein n=1 Tax=Clostridium felsineum TaxID=36839 RepID=UPI00214DD524|nr:hypothetical protein [Clostridium felsineum]MCR3760443.1 hypothetical protein [Clostridium felsineum]